MNGKFISYLRVSTRSQGESGLGLEAQRTSINNYLNGQLVLQEFVEIETGKNNRRPELSKALSMCVREGATLLIARMDRLSRNAAFLLNLLDSNVKFIAIDIPHADRFLMQILAVTAEKEALLISQRTKSALEAKKRAGFKLGGPNAIETVKIARGANSERARAFAKELAPVIDNIKVKGHVSSLRGIAEALNARGYKTPFGKSFAPQSVKNLLRLINSKLITK